MQLIKGKSTLLVVVVYLTIQLLVMIGLYLSSSGFQFHLGTRSFVYMLVEHYRGGRYFAQLVIANFDIGFLLFENPDALKKLYPRFFNLIHFLGIIVRTTIPMLLVYILFQKVWKRRSSKHQTICRVLTSLNLVAVIIGAFLLSLSIYLLKVAHPDYGFDFQLSVARSFLIISTLALLLHALLNSKPLWGKLRTFLFEASSPYPLAFIRIIFFTYQAFLFAVIFYLQHGNSIGKLEKVSLPGIGWLVEIVPVNSEIYSWTCWIGAVVSLVIAFGWRTRLFMLVNVPIVFYIVAAPNFFGKLWHEQVIIWMAWILASSPCFDVLSIDSKRFPRSEIVIDPKYGYHIRMIWLHFGVIYFFAGFYKLWDSGFDWALSDSMINQVQIEWFENYDRVSEWRLDRFPNLLKFGGLAVILFELLYPLLLFHRKLRWVSILGGLAMHNVLKKLMYIGFEWKLQVFYVVFIPFERLLKAVRPKLFNVSPGGASLGLRTLPVLFPAVILTGNIFCGVFKVNSYPFSIYPIYSQIVESRVRYFEYRVMNKGKEHVKFRQEAGKSWFRWEDYSRIEYHIINTYLNTGELDSVGVRTMWERWRIGVSSLSELDSVDVFVVERPLDPDSADTKISQFYLMSTYR